MYLALSRLSVRLVNSRTEEKAWCVGNPYCRLRHARSGSTMDAGMNSDGLTNAAEGVRMVIAGLYRSLQSSLSQFYTCTRCTMIFFRYFIPSALLFLLPCGLQAHNTLESNDHSVMKPRRTHITTCETHLLPIKTLSPRLEPITAFQHFLDVGLGWNMYYSSWHGSALPIEPAAWVLTTLYSHILTKAQSTWRQGPPKHSIGATFGQVKMVMVCKEKPLSWDFVEKYALKMLGMTREGWTGE